MSRKITMLAIITAGCIFVGTACNNATTTSENKDSTPVAGRDTGMPKPKQENGAMNPVATMTDNLKAIRMTGDYDQDFANIMIVHHQCALDISEQALPKLTDTAIRTMAQNMVADHQAEIADLRKFISNHDTTSADHKPNDGPNHTHNGGEHHEMADDVNAVMAKMMSITPTGNADKDYVTLMLAHHQNAVKLSQDEVSHGHHDNLKMMATKMMTDDKKEITAFEQWLATMK